jgi:NTE family protein
MATASIPGFRHEKINGNTFVDGIFCDSCPYDLLKEKGYEEIIAIRTNIPSIFHKKQESVGKYKEIKSNNDLGDYMMFSPKNSAANISLGYYDGLCYVKNLQQKISESNEAA